MGPPRGVVPLRLPRCALVTPGSRWHLGGVIRRAALLGLLALLAACGSAAPAAPAAVPEPELSAEAVYGRHAAVRGKVDVRIANGGADEVVVERYQVRHPLFEVVPPYDRRSALPPDGRARIVPVPFGAPDCQADVATGAVVVVTVRSGEELRDVSVPLADGRPGLEREHHRACATAAVRAAADVTVGPPWVPDGSTLRAALRLTRRGPGEVAVTEVSGSILLTLSPAGPLPVLEAGRDEAAAEVVLRAGRCEAHALTESKTSFTFPVFAALDGGEPVALRVTADEQGRAALQALLDRTCGTR